MAQRNKVHELGEFFGSVSAAARALDTTRAGINQWKNFGYIPPHWAMRVEKATGGRIKAVDILKEAEMVREARDEGVSVQH